MLNSTKSSGVDNLHQKGFCPNKLTPKINIRIFAVDWKCAVITPMGKESAMTPVIDLHSQEVG